ncbi:MAG: nucleoside/nucleotide kinase family protein, partial [Patescibacteria group bacterium]
MEEKSGKLIVLYGINNLGKSTQAKLLVERLKANGYKAEYLKYPIYDLNPSGVILNDYLRNGNSYELSAKEAQIIYALNRTQYQAELIDKLRAGINIIAEDYRGTGIAWGLGAGVDENFLKKINSHLVPEDLVFLFDGDRFRQAIENNHK